MVLKWFSRAWGFVAPLENTAPKGGDQRFAAWALLAAIAPAVTVLIAADMARIPTRLLWSAPEQAAAVIPWLIVGCLLHLWAPLAAQIASAALVRARPRRPWTRGARIATCYSLGAALAWVSYRTASSYAAFAAYQPLIAAFIILGVTFGVWLARFGRAGRDPGRRGPLNALWKYGAPVAAAIASATALAVHRRFFSDTYLEMHLVLLQVGFLALHASLAQILLVLPRVPRALSISLAALGAVAISLLIIAMPLLSTRTAAVARGPFLQKTALGVSCALLEWDPFSGEAEQENDRPVIEEDAHGAERFREMSGMPDLGKGTSLADFNILFVTMEAVRYGETSFATPAKQTTPHIVALAQDGAFWFKGAYTPAPVTVQVFSGIYSMAPASMSEFIGGEQPWLGRLKTSAVTVPEQLQSAGYQTFWVGHGLKLDGLEQGFDAITRVPNALKDPEIDKKILEKSIEQLEVLRKKDTKFFGWVFFASPHMYYYPHYSDWPAKTNKQKYLQELRYGDERVGELIDYLRGNGLIEKTIIVFMGDHGEEFGEHGGSGHVNLYEETVHVPLVVRIPGKRGKRVDAAVSTAYLFPWLLQRCTPTLREAAEKAMRRIWSPLLRATDGSPLTERVDNRVNRAALVDGKYEIIYDFRSKMYEMYDLLHDPMEKRDLFDRNSEVSAKYEARMRRYLDVRRALGHAERP